MDRLNVPRFLSLHPQLVPGRAPEPGVPCLDSVANRFPIGIRHHEDVLGLSVLHYNGKKAIPLLKVNVLESL